MKRRAPVSATATCPVCDRPKPMRLQGKALRFCRHADNVTGECPASGKTLAEAKELRKEVPNADDGVNVVLPIIPDTNHQKPMQAPQEVAMPEAAPWVLEVSRSYGRFERGFALSGGGVTMPTERTAEEIINEDLQQASPEAASAADFLQQKETGKGPPAPPKRQRKPRSDRAPDAPRAGYIVGPAKWLASDMFPTFEQAEANAQSGLDPGDVLYVYEIRPRSVVSLELLTKRLGRVRKGRA